MENLGRLIAEHPFFAGLSEPYRDEIVGCARNLRIEAGELVIRSGEPADSFYLVRRGLVAIQFFISGRGEITIQTVNPGSVLGWAWIFPPYVSYFDAWTLERTHVISFDGACLRRKCEEDPSLGYDLMKRFAQLLRDRLRSTHLQLLDLYGVSRSEVEV
jgi:CRP/FNR family transcriptional regulator, cyclic AMP receptor protein